MATLQHSSTTHKKTTFPRHGPTYVDPTDHPANCMCATTQYPWQINEGFELEKRITPNAVPAKSGFGCKFHHLKYFGVCIFSHTPKINY